MTVIIGEKRMLKRIARELAEHAPFTAMGAVVGILAMALVSIYHTPREISEALFYTFHPLHILFSTMVTTAMYRKHKKSPFWLTILICYAGPLIIATLSDAIFPYLEGSAINILIEFELPFMETAKMPFIGIPEWILVNAASFIGMAISFWKPTTRFPHMVHILISTWATLLYFTAFGTANWMHLLPIFFVFLFLAVWLPCCFSDIVFPLLWVREEHPSI
jgi:hypothetical protein